MSSTNALIIQESGAPSGYSGTAWAAKGIVIKDDAVSGGIGFYNISDSTKVLLDAAEKLGGWCAELSLLEVCNWLKVRF